MNRLIANTCRCENGTEATGAACTSADALICISCEPGYTKSGDACISSKSRCFPVILIDVSFSKALSISCFNIIEVK